MKRYGERRKLPPRGPLREVVRTEAGMSMMSEWDVLECGHRKLVARGSGAARRRCDDCLREREATER